MTALVELRQQIAAGAVVNVAMNCNWLQLVALDQVAGYGADLSLPVRDANSGLAVRMRAGGVLRFAEARQAIEVGPPTVTSTFAMLFGTGAHDPAPLARGVSLQTHSEASAATSVTCGAANTEFTLGAARGRVIETWVIADTGNGAAILYVGPSGTIINGATRRGVKLAAGQSVNFQGNPSLKIGRAHVTPVTL